LAVLAAVVGEQATALVLDLSTPDREASLITAGPVVTSYTDAIWTTNSDRLVLNINVGSDTSDTEALVVGEVWLRRWSESRLERLGFAPAPNGLIYDVDRRGEVLVREPVSGEVRSTVRGPGDLEPDVSETGVPIASIDPDGRSAAFVQAGQLRLEDLASGETRTVANGSLTPTSQDGTCWCAARTACSRSATPCRSKSWRSTRPIPPSTRGPGQQEAAPFSST